MRIVATILILTLSFSLNAQVYRNTQLPARTISLNAFGAKGDNSTSDAAIVKTVLKLASDSGYRVTGFGTFNLNNDTVRLTNLDLWATNKGSFVLRNGKYLEVKKSIKMENMTVKDFLNNTFPVFFWDTVKNGSGVVTYDGLPEGDFTIQIQNCDISNCNRLFNTGGIDVPKDSSRLVNSYIRSSTFTAMKYSAFNLPFYHQSLDISNNFFYDFDNTNFRNVFIVGLDNVFKTAGSYGLTIKNNKVSRCYGPVPTDTYYGFLFYSTGAIAEGNQFKEVSGPAIYAAGWDNTIHNNTAINDTVVTDFAYIIKGGTGEASPTAWAAVTNNKGKGKYLSGIYFDYYADLITVSKNQIELEENVTYTGDACLRILSHGMNRIDIDGNTFINKQTNSATQAVNITTDDTIGILVFKGNILESQAGGLKFNSQMIKEAQINNNPMLYAALNHNMRSKSTNAFGNTFYYPKGGLWMLSVNSSDPFYFKNNKIKPYFKDNGTSAIGRIFDIATDAATDSSYYYFSDNEYDLSNATVAFYVENPSYLRFNNERLTNSSALNSYFVWIRSASQFMDIEADNISIPFGKTFINNSLGTTGNKAKLKLYKSNLTGTVVSFTSATQANITKDSVVINRSIVPTNSWGSGWVYSEVPGAAGTGNVTSIESSSTMNQMVIMKGTDGKTVGKYTPTGEGFVYVDANGVPSISAGTGAGIDTVKHTQLLTGDGATTSLSIDTTNYIATKSDLTGLGTGSSSSIYFSTTYFSGTGNTVGDPITLAAPGGTGNVAIKENFGRLTNTTYTIGSGDVNLLYIGTANATWTLPAFNSTNHERVLYIRNNSSYTITFDKSIWVNESTSAPSLASGQWVKLLVDDTNDKIWVLLGL